MFDIENTDTGQNATIDREGLVVMFAQSAPITVSDAMAAYGLSTITNQDGTKRWDTLGVDMGDINRLHAQMRLDYAEDMADAVIARRPKTEKVLKADGKNSEALIELGEFVSIVSEMQDFLKSQDKSRDQENILSGPRTFFYWLCKLDHHHFNLNDGEIPANK